MRALVISLAIALFVRAQSVGVIETMRNADALIAAGRLADAEQLYKGVLAARPSDFDVNLALAMLYFRQGAWERASESYVCSLKTRPDHVKALFYLAQAYY